MRGRVVEDRCRGSGVEQTAGYAPLRERRTYFPETAELLAIERRVGGEHGEGSLDPG